MISKGLNPHAARSRTLTGEIRTLFIAGSSLIIISVQMIALLADNQNRKLINVLKTYGPESLIKVLLERVSIPEDVFCHELRDKQRSGEKDYQAGFARTPLKANS